MLGYRTIKARRKASVSSENLFVYTSSFYPPNKMFGLLGIIPVYLYGKGKTGRQSSVADITHAEIDSVSILTI